jgi:hypothetical protein
MATHPKDGCPGLDRLRIPKEVSDALIPALRAEIAKLREEREKLLALLKAAREHDRRCRYDMATIAGDKPIPDRDAPEEEVEAWLDLDDAISASCDLGPPLADCKDIQ